MNDSRRWLARLTAVSAMLLAGCSRSEAPPSVLAPVAQAFPNASATAVDPVDSAVYLAVAAAGSNDVETAAVSLEAIRSTPTLTPEQRTAVQDAMGQLQTSLAARAERGDAQAQQALNAIRGARARR